MKVRIGLLNKHDDWSTEKFNRYWQDHHGKLAAQLPGLQAYHQNLVVDSEQRGIKYQRGPESVDGFSQLWFNSLEQISSAFTKDLNKTLEDDLKVFIGRLRILTADPLQVIKPPAPGTTLKRMSFLRRRDDVSAAVFEHEWCAKHGDFVKEMPGVLGYRQNLITHRESPKGQAVDYKDLPIDGIVELWFKDVDSLNASFASPQGQATVGHGRTFIEEVTTFLVETHVVV